MDDDDSRVIAQCLTAAAHGPFFAIFDDEDIRTIIGCRRTELAQIIADWPHTDDADRLARVVNLVLTMLLSYPHREWDRFADYSTATPGQIAEVLTRWRGEDAFDPSPAGFFDRLPGTDIRRGGEPDPD